MKKNSVGEVSSVDKLAKLRKREIVFRVLTVIVVSIILAIMLRISRISDFQTAGDFFTGAVWLQILVISAVMAVILSTLYFYSIYVRRDLKKDKKLLPVLSISILLTFALAIVFSVLINVYVAPLVLCSLLVASSNNLHYLCYFLSKQHG